MSHPLDSPIQVDRIKAEVFVPETRLTGASKDRTSARFSDAELRSPSQPPGTSIDLYWIPLGAGGAGFVRFNGRVYEAINARLERRRPLDLYHTALEVRVPEGRFIIENAWPSPDDDIMSRGVVVEGPVASRRIARLRVFRYEVRRWRDGVIPDVGEAVASPQLLSNDPSRARCVLDLVDSVPAPIWGRDELGTGEMWNSNAVISWLLARSGLPAETILPPAGGRAPGWMAGIVAASRQAQPEDGTSSGFENRIIRLPSVLHHGTCSSERCR